MKPNKKELEYPEFGELAKDEYAYSESEKTEGRLKDRVLLKKRVNIHRFTYQDIMNMIAQTEAALAQLDKDEVRMKADRKAAAKQLDLWKKERNEIEKHFPEIVEEEEKLKLIPSPVDIEAPNDAPEDIEGVEEK